MFKIPMKKKKSSPKVVVLGLDGVPYSLLMEYMIPGTPLTPLSCHR